MSEAAALALRWQMSGRSQLLWPEVSAEALVEALQAVARATEALVRGAAQPWRWPIPLNSSPRVLGIAAFVTGMGPMLGYWIEQGALATDGAVARVFAEHLDHGRRRHERFTGHLVDVLDAFAHRGLPAIILKGLHTNLTYLPAPGTRPQADIDLLVPAARVDDARRALRDLGMEETQHRLRPRFLSEWRPAGGGQYVQSLELDHADNPWGLDLHIGLDRHYARGLRATLAQEFPSVAARLSVRGRPAHGLAQPLLTAFLALHASYGLPQMQLGRLVELKLVIDQDTARRALAWGALSQLLVDSGTLVFTYPAFALLERLAPNTVDPEFLARARAQAPRRMLRAVDQALTSGIYRSPSRTYHERFMWARTPWELILSWADFAWPWWHGPGSMWALYVRRLDAFRHRVRR